MKKIILILFLITFQGLFAQSSKQEKTLDSIFTMMQRQNQFNGSVLIAEKGRIILKKGYGYSNEDTRSSNNPATVFELASCSKQFTAAAIMLLKRQGKLRFEDKLSKYIPELDFWQDVTIYDMIKHTSGLPDYIMDMPKTWDNAIIATNNDVIKFYAARKDTLEFAPGSIHQYNNTNYVLLASIIEQVSGKSYADFLSENIFKPLKMKNTFVYSRRLHPQKLKNYAIGYTWAHNSFTKVTLDDPRHDDKMTYFLDGVAGSAKVNSTVEDLYKWITALKDNTFFSKSEFEEMTAVTKTSKGKDIPYGFGLDVSKGKDKFAFGHTGGWDGYMTFTYHDVVNDRTIITLQNFTMGASLFQNIMEVLKGQPLTTEYRKKVPLPEAALTKYTGTYISEDKNEEHIITALDGHLIYNSKKLQWDMRFFPVSGNEFQGARYGGTDGVMRFTPLEDGSVKLEMLQYGEIIGSGVKSHL
ncbi:serine hydrolase domain-containing protein [Flavobacterium sp. DGU11]|uniref:Serine hydrolase domain-containing protein n=1 Tax=Flavobacterium arundinis TaxID=3139143 RepID=A0ABU9HWH7_9FLAO